MSDTEREPIAYAFEIRTSKEYGWAEKVEFDHPRDSWCSYEGVEVRNNRPLHTEMDQ